MLDEPPTNDRLHVEVVSTSKRMGLLHPKVWVAKFPFIFFKVLGENATKVIISTSIGIMRC